MAGQAANTRPRPRCEDDHGCNAGLECGNTGVTIFTQVEIDGCGGYGRQRAGDTRVSHKEQRSREAQGCIQNGSKRLYQFLGPVVFRLHRQERVNDEEAQDDVQTNRRAVEPQ